MPTLTAICIEDLRSSEELGRFLRCVAVAEGRPGLSLSRHGSVEWEQAGADDRYRLVAGEGATLALVPAAGATGLVLRRSGREMEVTGEAPTPVLDQDEIEYAGRHLRIHVHGAAESAEAPVAVLMPRLWRRDADPDFMIRVAPRPPSVNPNRRRRGLGGIATAILDRLRRR
jgi:hypothetical protein